jgi:hypothetical protein
MIKVPVSDTGRLEGRSCKIVVLHFVILSRQVYKQRQRKYIMIENINEGW